MALRGQASQANTSAASSVTVTVSGIGIVSGDIVIFAMGSDSPTLTPPSGFSAISGITQISGIGGSTQMMMWYKVAGGSEPTSYTATASTSDLQTGTVCVFSGRNTSSPFDNVQTQAAGFGVSPFVISFTGFTPTQTGDDILVFICCDNSGTVYSTPILAMSAPAGFANSLTAYGAAAFTPATGVISNQGISGSATGTLSGTETWTDRGSWNMAAFMVALSPLVFVQPGSLIYNRKNVLYFI
jgi:hypothetical protein